jgi:hypothetical protein
MSNPITEDFYALSVVLTGYSAFELHGTGVGDEYFNTVKHVVGDDMLTELLTTYRQVEEKAAGDESKLEQLMRSEILSSTKLGPIARNIIQMWYVGNWYELPDAWYAAYHTTGNVRHTHVISAQAYQEGLVWKAMETKPMGAKWPGFGTWGEPLDVK